MVFLEKLAHLIEAHSNLCGLGHVFEMCYPDKVFKIVRALNSAKFLELFPGDVEIRPLFIFCHGFHVFFVDEYC